jgi:hypothetical protein
MFPRCARYNPEWIMAGISGAANPLRLTEPKRGVPAFGSRFSIGSGIIVNQLAIVHLEPPAPL